jgi:hypothetical protein
MNDLIFEGVSTKRLLDQIARLRGWDPAVATPIQSEQDRMCQLANHALERAWRFGWWPQLLLTRSVTYRPEWTDADGPYPLGEQVFWRGRYWECVNPEGSSLEPGTKNGAWSFVDLTEEETAGLTQHAEDAGEEPGDLSISDGALYFGTYNAGPVAIEAGVAKLLFGDAALVRLFGQTVATWTESEKDWAPCERTMVCGISYVRYGIEELDLSQGVYTLDPDRRADARALPAARCAFGCTVMQTPDRPFVPMPYVRFRPYAPRLSAAPWLATTPYRKGDLVMGSDGESYEAWIDVPAGVNPAGESEESSSESSSGEPADPTLYWAPRRCPRMFEDFVVQYAAAELQTDDNARGRGLQAAEAELKMLYNNMVRQVKQPGRAFTRVFR